MRYIFNNITGGFFRTLGRILAYIAVGTIIVYLSQFIFVGSVHAETISLDKANVTIDNNSWYSNYGYYSTTISTSGTNLPISFMCTLNNVNCPKMIALVSDVCFSSSIDEFKRAYNYGQSCGNSCFTNNLSYTDLKRTCSVNNTDSGYMYRLYMPINKWDYGVGNSNYWLVNDSVNLKAKWYNGTIMFTNLYLTDELVSNQSDWTELNSSINSLNSSISNQSQQQHEDAQATQNAINNVANSITDTSAPTLDGLGNSAGWLPPGPVDSILNLPLALFNNLTTNLGKTCTPVTLNVPFVNKSYQLPCLNSIYNQIGNVGTLLNIIGTLVSGLMLYKYFMKLYKWVDDTLSFRENNWQDWGGV